jgi:hypothetical protein
MTIRSAKRLVLATSLITAVLCGTALAAGGSRVVLGSRAFAPMGKGFGTVAPREIFNGGDPSGLVEKIQWTHWGQRTATGWGETSIFKPHGGYYPKLVRSELRATRLGRCSDNGRRAYTHLQERVPSRPGGPLGKWFAWSGEKSICHLPAG